MEYNEDGTVRGSSVVPLVDGGTEGFKGNVRVLIPGMNNACLECNLDLYPPQVLPSSPLPSSLHRWAHGSSPLHRLARGLGGSPRPQQAPSRRIPPADPKDGRQFVIAKKQVKGNCKIPPLDLLRSPPLHRHSVGSPTVPTYVLPFLSSSPISTYSSRLLHLLYSHPLQCDF